MSEDQPGRDQSTPYSEPVLKVLHCVSVASLGDGKPDGFGADLEDVRDLLVMRFGMTTEAAEGAIDMAKREGAIEDGDPQP